MSNDGSEKFHFTTKAGIIYIYFTYKYIYIYKIYQWTFVAVPDGVEVDVVVLVAEEHEREPGVECVDGHYEEDAYDAPLLHGERVVAEVQEQLQQQQHHHHI